jgi:hypothetical protein
MVEQKQNWWDRLANMDKRWVFLCILLAVGMPLFFPINLPMRASKPVRDFYDEIEALPQGSMVLLSGDYDPGTKAELYPQNVAILHQLCRRHIKVVAIALWPTGPPMVERAFNEVAVEQYGYVYGEDFVNLGFKEGREAVMVEMGRSIREAFPVDFYGTPIGEIPLMAKVENYESFPLLIDISAGYPGTKEYVQYTQDRFDIQLLSGAPAVSVPEFSAYYQSRQIRGMLTGIAGGAEYEALIERPGLSARAMDGISIGHLVIIFFIIIGNVFYFMGGRRKV